jgi:hypothetical protein
MLRAPWVDEITSTQSADPDWKKLAPIVPTRLYFSARAVTKAQLDEARKRCLVGIYRVPEWDADLEPTEWAALLSDDVKRLGGNTAQLAVQANAETHSEAWLVAFWNEWRRLRPTRATSWAFEGIQGGRLGIAPGTFRAQILSWRIRLVPEAYLGDMTPLDPAGVKRELEAWGFPGSIISPFYDAAALPAVWDGFAFTQERLP